LIEKIQELNDDIQQEEIKEEPLEEVPLHLNQT